MILVLLCLDILRQNHGEFRPLPVDAFYLNVSPQQIQRALHDRQTEPDTAFEARITMGSTIELVENHRQLLAFDANASILYDDSYTVTVGTVFEPCADVTLLREFYRVADQVEDDLLHQFSV